MIHHKPSRASQNPRVGHIIFDILNVIIMFLKREDQIHPNLLGWWNYSGNRVKKHCREHEIEMLEKHQCGVETHLSPTAPSATVSLHLPCFRAMVCLFV